jgi:threonyl-tRNA synthetase
LPVITLPDGSQREFAQAVSVLDVAADIGAGLAKATLAGRVNDVLVDGSYLIENDATLSIVTSRDEEGIDVIRHSAAHLLAQAVKQLFPTAQVTIGPVIDNGFFYDFAFERPFTNKKFLSSALRFHAMTRLPFSEKKTRNIKRKLLKAFLPMKCCRYTVRGNLPIFAGGLTFLIRLV